jgi:MFS family permease
MTAKSPPSIGAAYQLQRGLACAGTSVLLGLTQGFGFNLVTSNLSGIQGALGATATEAAWLTTAYFATALSASLLLFKFRLQFGLDVFAKVGLLCFVIVSGLHLLTHNLSSAIAVRAALGFAAAPLSALAILYMIEAFPKRLALAGVILGFGTLQFGTPLSRVIPVELLEIGQWQGLFLIDVALALLSFGLIRAVPLTPMPLQTAFSRGDMIAFPLYAIGLALLCVVVTQGRLHWWTDAQWLGLCLAGAIACIGLYVLYDLDRPQPMLNLRWATSPYMLHFLIAVLLFRVLSAEQTIGIVGLMTALGQSNEQMRTLFILVSVGTLAGVIIALAIAVRNRLYALTMLAATMFLIAARMDSDATSLTRPTDLYFSQTLLAVGYSLFFAASALFGFIPVIREGGKNIVTFIAAFSLVHFLGSLLSSAWISTYLADRQQLHFAALTQQLQAVDPLVATRLTQLGGSVARYITDASAREMQGVYLLTQTVSRESLVLAYNDVFHFISALGVGVLVYMTILAVRAARAKPLVQATTTHVA